MTHARIAMMALAALVASAAAVPSVAQNLDHRWAPDNSGFSSGTAVVPGIAPGAAGTSSVRTETTTVPVVETPRNTGATWRWAALQVCITTPNGAGAYDANQWQTCEGTECPSQGRGCYSVWTGAHGSYSNEPGTIAPAFCLSQINTPNPALCYR